MIVVADTSPLANLAAIGELDLLRRLYEEIVVPESVAAELRVGADHGLYAPFVDSSQWIEVRQAANGALVAELSVGLDVGESEAIALSIELAADLLLVDERRGRAAAEARGIRTVGLVGSLAACKSKGIVTAVRPLLDRLRVEAGFWISDDLYRRVVGESGE